MRFDRKDPGHWAQLNLALSQLEQFADKLEAGEDLSERDQRAFLTASRVIVHLFRS